MNTEQHPFLVLDKTTECVAVFVVGTTPAGRKRAMILESRTAYTPAGKALGNGACQNGHNGGGAHDGETAMDAAIREISEEYGINFAAEQLTYVGKYEQLQPAKWQYAHVFTVEVDDFTWGALSEAAGRTAAFKGDIVHRVARGNVRLATLGLLMNVPELADEWLPDDVGALNQLLDVLESCEQGFSTENVRGLTKLYNFRKALGANA